MLLQSAGLLSKIKRGIWVYYSVLDLTSRFNIVEETITPKGEGFYMQNSVFVLDTNKQPLSPCRPSIARKLLRDKKAAVWKMYPFTVILKREVQADRLPPVQLKVDPGSKTTGMALVQEGKVVWAAELEHRGEKIRDDLVSRRVIRITRRQRKTRYRKPGFQANQKTTTGRPDGWLSPSLKSRLDNLQTWFAKLYRLAPIVSVSMELVRFDMQLMQNAEISGVEYQQGELQGYEIREYLLEKWQRKCAYCGAKDCSLEIEHITPKSRGGSNRVSNLTLACHDCNQKKGSMTAKEFGFPKIQEVSNRSFGDAAAVNSVRWAMFEMFKATGLPLEVGTGGRTKFNRARQEYPKKHWIDAACVGESGGSIELDATQRPLLIKAVGRGSRQMVNSDKYGFPRGKAKAAKRVNGFQTGDIVKASVPKGKYMGTHRGRCNIRANGSFRINKIDISWRYCRRIQRADGYSYGIQ